MAGARLYWIPPASLDTFEPVEILLFGLYRRQRLAEHSSHTGMPSIDRELMIRMLIMGYRQPRATAKLQRRTGVSGECIHPFGAGLVGAYREESDQGKPTNELLDVQPSATVPVTVAPSTQGQPGGNVQINSTVRTHTPILSTTTLSLPPNIGLRLRFLQSALAAFTSCRQALSGCRLRQSVVTRRSGLSPEVSIKKCRLLSNSRCRFPATSVIRILKRGIFSCLSWCNTIAGPISAAEM